VAYKEIYISKRKKGSFSASGTGRELRREEAELSGYPSASCCRRGLSVLELSKRIVSVEVAILA
jgi:hypothetical protein